jgi:chromosome condensin MukBEF ATPase and DNA-binding subunit MukB
VTMNSIEREVGSLEARMQTVETELHAIRSDVREIRDALVTARGGWRTLILLLSLASAIGAALGRYLPIIMAGRI